MNFMITLLICSVAMSAITFIYMMCMPLLAKRYSEKGRYYAWLIIVIGLIIPYRPQINTPLINVEAPGSAPTTIIRINSDTSIELLPPASLTPAPSSAVPMPSYPQPTLAPTVPPSMFAPSSPPSTLTPSTHPPMPPHEAPHATLQPSQSAGLNTDPGTMINITIWHIAMAVWMAGAGMYIVYHLTKHYRFIRMSRRWSEGVTDGHVLSMFESLKTEMGIKKRIPLELCSFTSSPMMIGFLKPHILLPKPLPAMDELRFILKHELVHYRRKDIIYKCLILAATAMHWFNPIVHLMAKTVNSLCETSCDAEILRSADTPTRRSYGEMIIGVSQNQSRLNTALSTYFYGGRNNMKKRLMSIMDASKKNLGILLICLTMVLVLCTGLVLAATGTPVDDGGEGFDDNPSAPAGELPGAGEDERSQADKLTDDGNDPNLATGADTEQNNHSGGGLNTQPSDPGHLFYTTLPAHEIEDTDKGIRFTMIEDSIQGDFDPSAHMPFDEIAKIAAAVAYEQFGINVDGMWGKLSLSLLNRGFTWHGFFFGNENAGIAEESNATPVFYIDAVTGELISIPAHEIENAEKGIRFTMWDNSMVTFLDPLHGTLFDEDFDASLIISFEDAAVIIEAAINERFDDICLDGLTGYINLTRLSSSRYVWDGYIISEELTQYKAGNELFYYAINAVTGEVITLEISTPAYPLVAG